jgi:hypothetical protein
MLFDPSCIKTMKLYFYKAYVGKQGGVANKAKKKKAMIIHW